MRRLRLARKLAIVERQKARHEATKATPPAADPSPTIAYLLRMAAWMAHVRGEDPVVAWRERRWREAQGRAATR